MRSRMLLFYPLVLLLSSVAAYALRDLIYQLVIVPLAYIFWVLGVFYQLIPQVFLWVILIVVVLISAGKDVWRKPPMVLESKNRRILPAGPIELLAGLVKKRRQGNYYKWLLANRLGKLARELMDQREGQRSAKRFTRLVSRDWNLPKDVLEYLDAGLSGSIADYPRSSWLRPKQTPLDVPPILVIELLEAEMENNQHGYHKGL